MTRRRIISGAALAATLALPATAGAQDTTEKNCLKFDSKDKSALTYTFTGNTLTLTPRGSELLRVKTSKRGTVKVTRTGDAYSFDLPKVEGETFTVTKRKSGTGKLRLRVKVLEAAGDRLTRFEVKVKAFDKVVCESDEDETETESGDDDAKSDGDSKSDDKKSDDDKSRGRGRGRGPESEEERKSRTERGEGRGPETDAEREDRKDDDDS